MISISGLLLNSATSSRHLGSAIHAGGVLPGLSCSTGHSCERPSIRPHARDVSVANSDVIVAITASANPIVSRHTACAESAWMPPPVTSRNISGINYFLAPSVKSIIHIFRCCWRVAWSSWVNLQNVWRCGRLKESVTEHVLVIHVENLSSWSKKNGLKSVLKCNVAIVSNIEEDWWTWFPISKFIFIALLSEFFQNFQNRVQY